MKPVIFREKVMLSCMIVLIFFFVSIFVRLSTRIILVKKLHWDNEMTQTILFDSKGLQSVNNKVEHKTINIAWNEVYPFEKDETTDRWNVLKGLQAKIRIMEEDIVEEWTTEHLLSYRLFVEMGRNLENKIGWNVVNPAMKVYRFSDGYLTYIDVKKNQNARIESICNFADFVKSQGGEFLYIQSPNKTNPFFDKELKGIDYANDNTDRLLQGLCMRNISVYDLRNDFYKDYGNAGWHQAFFMTDHHWKPDTAIWVSKKINEKLTKDYDVDVNLEHFAFEDYKIVKYKEYFLGSQGKKTTLANTPVDDFEIYYPKFLTNIHIDIPKYCISKRGDFSIFYDMQALGKGDYYIENPYAVYSYSNQPEMVIHNYENENLKDKKILLIKDSMLNVTIPFLSMGLKDLRVLDLREFTGSVKSYVMKYKPDIVLVMYGPPLTNDIVWEKHNDLYDFR